MKTKENALKNNALEEKPTVGSKTDLFRSASVVSAMTLSSRVLGFVRDVVIASLFGASGLLDAFFVAFKIPNFFRRLFAEGAFSQAFVPVLTDYQGNHDHKAVQGFIHHVAGNLLLVLTVVTVVAIFAAPWVVVLFAPGFLRHPEQWHIAGHWLRITFPYLALISYTALGGAILNTQRRFAVPAFTPVLLNLTLIAMALWGRMWFSLPITALAVGVLLAGVIQCAFQWPFLRRLQLEPIPKPCWRDPGVKRVLALMLPTIIGASVTQIGVLIDTLFASFLTPGSISWLYYSDRLTFFPLGVFGVALATVVLPHLSRQYGSDSHKIFNSTLHWSLRYIGTIGLPASIGLMVLAGPLLCTLFFRGAFTVTDVLMTERSLLAFAIGVPAFMAVKVLTSSYYARQDMQTPMRIAIIAVLVNVFLNFLLIIPLQHAGLALATTIASYVNVVLLLLLLKRRDIFKRQKGWLKIIGQWVVANGAMVAFLMTARGPLTEWIAWSWQQRAWHLFFLVGGGILCYGIVLLLCGFKVRVLYAPTDLK